jgi:hypothetical protein
MVSRLKRQKGALIMNHTGCAKAVMLAAIAAGGLAGTAKAAVTDVNTNPEVALSSAVAHSVPLAYLKSIASAKANSVDIDLDFEHLHIHDSATGENIFEV